MFTEEGRWRGVVMSSIKDDLHDLELDELDLVLEFVKTLSVKKLKKKN